MALAGAAYFGLVVGWMTQRTLRRSHAGRAQITDLGAAVGVIGGAVITAVLVDARTFGAYAIGLAVGLFGYLIVGVVLHQLKLFDMNTGKHLLRPSRRGTRSGNDQRSPEQQARVQVP